MAAARSLEQQRDMPLAIRTRLYQAFGIEAACKHDAHQLTCRATLTTSTPHTVTATLA
jgi:hypothetical protein